MQCTVKRSLWLNSNIQNRKASCKLTVVCESGIKQQRHVYCTWLDEIER